MKNNYWKERAEKFNKTNWVKNSLLLDALLSLIPNKKNYGKILEVGVGTGVVANKVVDKYTQNLPSQVELKLPKLKKVGTKLKLPKLKKILLEEAPA